MDFGNDGSEMMEALRRELAESRRMVESQKLQLEVLEGRISTVSACHSDRL